MVNSPTQTLCLTERENKFGSKLTDKLGLQDTRKGTSAVSLPLQLWLRGKIKNDTSVHHYIHLLTSIVFFDKRRSSTVAASLPPHNIFSFFLSHPAERLSSLQQVRLGCKTEWETRQWLMLWRSSAHQGGITTWPWPWTQRGEKGSGNITSME